MAQTETAFEQLWDDDTGQYYSRDADTGALIRLPTIATFIPLYAGIPSSARAERLLALMQSRASFWPRFPIPSVPADAPAFSEARYWMGPTWVNINWVVVQGLRAYGATALADELRSRTLALVERAGFSEYFSPLTGAGFGAGDFSWTAALFIDLLAANGS